MDADTIDGVPSFISRGLSSFLADDQIAHCFVILACRNEKDVIQGPIADVLARTVVEADIICVNLRPSAVRLFSVLSVSLW